MTTLNALQRGEIARITGFKADIHLEEALREIGFAEGDDVELLERGLVGGSPISVRLDRTILALRKSEALAILVEKTK